MIGVTPLEQVDPDARPYSHPYRMSEGTLHHMFDGGWMWVIPFNNHPEHTNPCLLYTSDAADE